MRLVYDFCNGNISMSVIKCTIHAILVSMSHQRLEDRWYLHKLRSKVGVAAMGEEQVLG